MTSSPLANLADQTAELLATIADLATIEELRDAEADDHRKALDPLGAAEVLRRTGPRGSQRGRAPNCKRPVASSKGAFEERRRELSQLARAQSLLEDGLDLGDVVVGRRALAGVGRTPGTDRDHAA